MKLLNKIKSLFKKEVTYSIEHSFDKDFIKLMDKLYKQLGEEVFDIQGIAKNHMDIIKYTDQFFGNSATNMADRTVDPNANNSDKSILQYYYSNNKALMRLTSLFFLWEKTKQLYGKAYADMAIAKIVSGKIFVNDLHNILTGYCYAFDLTIMVNEGLTFFTGNMKITKPKYSNVFIDLVIQATSYISNQITGAIAYPNFFLLLDWYYRKEFGKHYMTDILNNEMPNTKKIILGMFKNLIYSLNWSFRGSESSFTNLSVLDKGFVDRLFDGYCFPDMSYIDEESKLSLIKLSKMFFEYFNEINCERGIFTFPVMTLAISVDEKGNYLDPDFVKWAAKANHEKSLGNIFISEPNSFSSCCRLVSVLEKKYQNSFGVSGISVGSHRVIGLNLASMKDFKEIKENALVAISLLRAQREIIEIQNKKGFLPLYEKNWINLDSQYSTIGFVGAYEYASEYALRNPHSVMPGGSAIALSGIMRTALECLNDLAESETNKAAELNLKHKYNIEQIPAESMAVRLAKIDRVLGRNTKYEIYSNQYIPLINKASMSTRIKLQGDMDRYTTGGAILHINFMDDTEIPEERYLDIINKANKEGVKYFSVNYVFNKCTDGHYTRGSDKCSICGKPIEEKFTRVVGFLTSVKHWNKVRREYEFPKESSTQTNKGTVNSIAVIYKDAYAEYKGENSVIFFYRGCNYRCLYCYNSNLWSVKPDECMSIYKAIEDGIDDLTTAVVFCGGEATLHNVDEDIKIVKELYPNMKTKLFTNGTNHRKVISSVLNGLDELSLDIKYISEQFGFIIGRQFKDCDYIKKIKNLLLKLSSFKNLKIEIRTVKSSEFSQEEIDLIEKTLIEIKKTCDILGMDVRYYIQEERTYE